jgi:hypothetical protein
LFIIPENNIITTSSGSSELISNYSNLSNKPLPIYIVPENYIIPTSSSSSNTTSLDVTTNVISSTIVNNPDLESSEDDHNHLENHLENCNCSKSPEISPENDPNNYEIVIPFEESYERSPEISPENDPNNYEIVIPFEESYENIDNLFESSERSSENNYDYFGPSEE